MNTRKKGAIVVVFALTALLARPQVALAQVTTDPIKGSWEGLKAIPPGDKLEVDLRNGQTLKGRLISVSDTVLTIEREKRTTDVTRADTLRVFRVITKSAKKATLIGLGIGAGVGVGVASGSAAAASGSGEPHEYGLGILIAGAIGVGVGTLIGYIIGSRKQKALIYETR